MATENENVEILEEGIEDFINLDDLESKLFEDIDNDLNDLEFLRKQEALIGNPNALGEVVKNVVWEQFQNLIGVKAGKDFIETNRENTLDLSNSAHIQTTENFEKGIIATHNDKIDYKQRYDEWNDNFQKDVNGNIVTHSTRTGTNEASLKKDARTPFDKGRPAGSIQNRTDMDHTISAGEIIRDPEANAHLSKQEQIEFANSSTNLNEIESDLNRSKGDLNTDDWLDNPNAKGQKPSEIFDISDDKDKQLRDKNKEAREEYKKRKEEGKQKSIETGRQSQKEEAFRIGKSATKAVLLQLLAELIKEIFSKLAKWLKSKEKKLKTLIESLKNAIHSFINDLKKKLIRVGNTVITTIATAIIGPIVGTLKKIWMLLKQGWSSLKQAIAYLRSPDAKKKPFNIVMLEVGKIVMAALTVGGALILSEIIEKGLMAIPIFTIQIPLLGSLANILGLFLGAVISGLIGAIAINLIDKLIAKQQQDKLKLQVALQTRVALKGQELKTLIKLKKTYETVDIITEQTNESLENSEMKERKSFINLENAYNDLESLINKQ